MTECPICLRPIADTGAICHTCTASLREDLLQLARRVIDLQHTVIRQARIDDPGGHATEQPLMFSYAASEVATVVINTLTTWTRDIEEERGITMPTEPAPNGIVGPTCHGCLHDTCRDIRNTPARPPIEARCALWLSTQVDWLRHRGYAEDAFGELDYCCTQVRYAVDRPAPRLYVGPCDVCDRDMYARKDARVVKCTPCDLEYDIEPRREWLLEKADDQLAHASLIARAVTNLGEPVTPERIRQWASRKRITSHGTDAFGRPLYRVSEVRALLATLGGSRHAQGA